MKLVYVGKVVNIYPIENADRIESLEVVCGAGGKWRGTAMKSQFQIGDLCEVYLQDSIVPQTERFDFMSKRNWRVRMERLRGVPSECLIMPLETIGDVGDDITELCNVTKYDKQLPILLGGSIIGHFPSFIPKTDEPNFQTAQHLVDALRGQSCYCTIKADGSSGTVFWRDGVVHACSRNYELANLPNAAVWTLVEKYNLERPLKSFPEFALQFEIVGPGIQKNPMGLKELEMRLFNIYDWKRQEYFPYGQLMTFAEVYKIPTVTVIVSGGIFDFSTDEELRQYAEQKYDNGKQAEGIVFRPMEEQRIGNERLSFKVINLLYKEA